jgi:hypothetical protein
LTYLWAESENSETAAGLRLKEELEGLTGFERDDKKMDALKPIRFLNKFHLELVDEDKDAAYYGETVQPGETDKVLLRWKLSDTDYRAIFGDLSARTVTPEELAEPEKP